MLMLKMRAKRTGNTSCLSMYVFSCTCVVFMYLCCVMCDNPGFPHFWVKPGVTTSLSGSNPHQHWNVPNGSIWFRLVAFGGT